MYDKNNSLVYIVGASSYLGEMLTKYFSDKKGYIVSGTYNEHVVNSLNKNKGALYKEKNTFLQVDLLKDYASVKICDHIREFLAIKHIFIIYCAGRWKSGPFYKNYYKDIEEVSKIEFITPVNILTELHKVYEATKITYTYIAVTGIGGEKSAVMYNSIYSANVSALHNYIRSAGTELAGGKCSCFALAVGLFDKGQPYIKNLCKDLNIKQPSNISHISQFIIEIVSMNYHIFNGGVLEINEGLFNYQETTRLLSNEQ